MGWATEYKEPTPEELKQEIARLRNMLKRLLDTRSAEAKARMAYENACNNFFDCTLERHQYGEAMMEASNVEHEAREMIKEKA